MLHISVEPVTKISRQVYNQTSVNTPLYDKTYSYIVNRVMVANTCTVVYQSSYNTAVNDIYEFSRLSGITKSSKVYNQAHQET